MKNDDNILAPAHMEFLSLAGWGDATANPLAGDASTRRYLRLHKNDRSAVLMIAPPNAESAPCPKDASPEARRTLGYNACARLAGPNLNAFTAIASALRDAGLSAPGIYADDPEQGLALIEDFGDDLFTRVVGTMDEAQLYKAAIDVLVALRNNPPSRPSTDAYSMMDYDATALLAEVELLTQWYWPLKKGAEAPNDICAEYNDIFQNITTTLSPPHSFVLRDYHAENLLWMPERHGVQKVGLIDFQDGLYGAAAYDVVSLLEDARRDVPPKLAAAMFDHYCNNARADSNFNREAFLNDYAILATQRNAKILGIFARLAKRDHKPRYLDLLPRVEAHFRNDLERPGLERLRQFFATHIPDLAP